MRCSQRWGEPRRWAWGLLSNPWSRALLFAKATSQRDPTGRGCSVFAGHLHAKASQPSRREAWSSKSCLALPSACSQLHQSSRPALPAGSTTASVHAACPAPAAPAPLPLAPCHFLPRFLARRREAEPCPAVPRSSVASRGAGLAARGCSGGRRCSRSPCVGSRSCSASPRAALPLFPCCAHASGICSFWASWRNTGRGCFPQPSASPGRDAAALGTSSAPSRFPCDPDASPAGAVLGTGSSKHSPHGGVPGERASGTA